MAEKLSKEDIRTILLDSQDSVIEKYRRMFAYLGFDLKLKDEDIDRIVEYCYTNPIGVRGLEYMVYKILEDDIYEASCETI